MKEEVLEELVVEESDHKDIVTDQCIISLTEREECFEVYIENTGDKILRPTDVTTILLANNVNIGKIVKNAGKTSPGEKSYFVFSKVSKTQTKKKGKK